MTELNGMSLDEAILHCKEVAKELEDKGGCEACVSEHEQLAVWLEELADLRAFKYRVMQAVNKI